MFWEYTRQFVFDDIKSSLTNNDFAQGSREKTHLDSLSSLHVEVAHQFIGHQPENRKVCGPINSVNSDNAERTYQYVSIRPFCIVTIDGIDFRCAQMQSNFNIFSLHPSILSQYYSRHEQSYDISLLLLTFVIYQNSVSLLVLTSPSLG